MSRRRLFLDEAPGEVRGIVTLDDRPERLLIQRDDDEPRLALGARVVARVAEVEPALATAFLDLGQGLSAMLPFRPEERPVRGQAIAAEIRAEPRRGKLATARSHGPAEGAPRLLAPAPSIPEQLRTLAPGVDIERGSAARQASEDAEAEALEPVHPLPGGGAIAIEPTRALTAVDVDVGERKGGDSKRVTRQANLVALAEAARLLRLKGLGGLIVVDLAGRGHDGGALLAAARAAFAQDNPGVAFGPISRFGAIELTVPRRTTPVLERLCREDGAPSDRALAQRLIRRLQAEAEAQPGARLAGRCAPGVAEIAQALLRQLAEKVGARVEIAVSPNFPRERLEVATA
jgi:Ribonuclease G/E